MWRMNDPQGNEAAKIKYEIVPYTRGRGLDLGCGPFKAYKHFIGVDNGHHWGTDGADVAVETCEVLDMFSDNSMDFVFSSHLLEHIKDTKGALKEWMRVIKPGGNLVLYLPHGDLYPKCGTAGANPDHKHDLYPESITAAMKYIGYGWDLIIDEVRDQDYGEGEQGNEYSFLQVFRKREDNYCNDLTKGPKPEKTVCVVRYGAVGDMMQACSILPALKDEGYHIVFCTTPQGHEVLRADPHIDEFIIQDKDQVPNPELQNYWNTLRSKHDRFINLSESAEGSLLAIKPRAQWFWPKEARHEMMNVSYLEFSHLLSGVPLPPRPAFYPTREEREWAIEQRTALGEDTKAIMWVVRGSSVHKMSHYIDQVIARLLVVQPDSRIIMVGDELCQIFEAGWENEPRVLTKSGKWSFRQTIAFAQVCDAVIGPETGILNAIAMEDVAKVAMLSHSSEKNLITHWNNAVALAPSEKDVPCYPCHQLHYGWETCNVFNYTEEWCVDHGISTMGGLLEEGVKVARCSAYILPDIIYNAIIDAVWPRGKMRAIG